MQPYYHSLQKVVLSTKRAESICKIFIDNKGKIVEKYINAFMLQSRGLYSSCGLIYI